MYWLLTIRARIAINWVYSHQYFNYFHQKTKPGYKPGLRINFASCGSPGFSTLATGVNFLLAWLHNRFPMFLPGFYTVHSTQYTVHSTQYTVHSTQYTVHSTQYTVHSTQYTVHSTQYTVHSTQYTVHSTQYTVHSTQYTVHSTQYTVHSTQHCTRQK